MKKNTHREKHMSISINDIGMLADYECLRVAKEIIRRKSPVLVYTYAKHPVIIKEGRFHS